MQINTNYTIASIFSFLIHASLILFLVGYFYSEKKLIQYTPLGDVQITGRLKYPKKKNVNIM